MNHRIHSPFAGQLEVVSTLRDQQIAASIVELQKHDEMTVALRSMLGMGVDINDLSEASGLTPTAIRKRAEGDLAMSEDLEGLAGLR
jgi:hypothetical protein